MRVGLRSGSTASAVSAAGAPGGATGTSSLASGSAGAGLGGRNSSPSGNVSRIVLSRGQLGRQELSATSGVSRPRPRQRTLGSRCKAPFIPDAKLSTPQSVGLSPVDSILPSPPGRGAGSEGNVSSPLASLPSPVPGRGGSRAPRLPSVARPSLIAALRF